MPAEHDLLGALLLAGNGGLDACRRVVDVVRQIVGPTDMAYGSSGVILEAIFDVVDMGKPCDVLGVAEALRVREQLDKIGGETKLIELASSGPAVTNAGHYGALVRDAAVRRQQFRMSTELREASLNGGAGSDLLERLTSLQETGATGRADLTVISAVELCDRPDPDGGGRLLGPALMAGSRTIVGGHTGHGKTTIAVAMAAAYVTGGEFLGWTGVGGRALIIDLEQGERTIKRRLREAGLDGRADVDLLIVSDGLALDSSAPERAALDRIFTAGQYGLVLLDPHYKAHQSDANDEAQVKALMRYLDGQRAKHEFALMIPTHGRKPPNTGAGRLTVHDIAAGSGAIVRGAEIILAVEITKPGVTNLYAFKHRDGDDELPVHGDPWTLSFSRESGYQRVDTTTGERKASAEEIAAWIHEQGGRATPGEIKDRFDIADATLRDRRPKLAELGIDYTGTGKNAVYVANHPAPRTPRLLRGQAIAGSEPDETKGFHPAPRDPALETAAGSGNRSEQGFSTTPHPAPPKGGSPTTAGSGQPSTTTIDADTSDGFTRASGVVR